MRGNRDGPGKGKVASSATFFAGKKRKVYEMQQDIRASNVREPLQEIRRHLFQMLVDDTILTRGAEAVLYAQIDEILHAPMLIWSNEEIYNSWANYLGRRTNSFDSGGDTEVSLFLWRKMDEL